MEKVWRRASSGRRDYTRVEHCIAFAKYAKTMQCSTREKRARRTSAREDYNCDDTSPRASAARWFQKLRAGIVGFPRFRQRESVISAGSYQESIRYTGYKPMNFFLIFSIRAFSFPLLSLHPPATITTPERWNTLVRIEKPIECLSVREVYVDWKRGSPNIRR